MIGFVRRLGGIFSQSVVISVPVVLFPALTLVVRGSANKCMAFLLLCSSICFISRSAPHQNISIFNKFWAFHLSMASMLIACVANQLMNGAMAWPELDVPLRLALFAPMLWILLLPPPGWLKQVQWGFVVGAGLAALQIYLLTGRGIEKAQIVSFTNAIPYGDISLLLGVCSVLSLGWSHRRAWVSNGLKIAGGMAGIYASFLSQSRGGWIAIPFFMVLGLVAMNRSRKNSKTWLFVLILAIILFGSIGTFSKSVQTRFIDAKTNITDFYSGKNIDTSVGIRFQLWKGSLVIFREHPLLGVGR